MSKNKNLHSAKRKKNDEFYTQLKDIEAELKHYEDLLEGKSIYCPCDDESSNFWKYFVDNFDRLGIKEVRATHISSPVLLSYSGKKVEKTQIESGDFRSEACRKVMEDCDVVITNPPFSLFREFVSQLYELDKKYLIIGNKNAITYKNIFPLIKDNKMWLGMKLVKQFLQPNGAIKTFGNIGWWTNLPIQSREEGLLLSKIYNKKNYPKYDNYNAINVDKVIDIPIDYKDEMGVPITFLEKYNPDQFEILGIANSARWIGYECLTIIDGRKKYNRLIIKRLPEPPDDIACPTVGCGLRAA